MINFLKTDLGNIAYHKKIGHGQKGKDECQVGVIFIHGLMSDMEGTKALFLEQVAEKHGIDYIRFDCRGHGQSADGFRDFTIGGGVQNLLAVLDNLTTKPQILVGSSMGGWLMTLAALKRPKRICGLIGLAAAPDFTETLIWEKLTEKEKCDLNQTGEILMPCDYDGGAPYPITKNLITEGRNHLLLDKEIPLSCPVRLLQGMKDDDVPYQVAEQLLNAVTYNDVQLTLIKDGDHRLSREQDLKILESNLLNLL